MLARTQPKPRPRKEDTVPVSAATAPLGDIMAEVSAATLITVKASSGASGGPPLSPSQLQQSLQHSASHPAANTATAATSSPLPSPKDSSKPPSSSAATLAAKSLAIVATAPGTGEPILDDEFFAIMKVWGAWEEGGFVPAAGI